MYSHRIEPKTCDMYPCQHTMYNTTTAAATADNDVAKAIKKKSHVSTPLVTYISTYFARILKGTGTHDDEERASFEREFSSCNHVDIIFSADRDGWAVIARFLPDRHKATTTIACRNNVCVYIIITWADFDYRSRPLRTLVSAAYAQKRIYYYYYYQRATHYATTFWRAITQLSVPDH